MTKSHTCIMKTRVLLFLILLICSIRVLGQDIDDFERLRNLINEQIKKDNIRQKNIINISLPIEIKNEELNKKCELENLEKVKQLFERNTSFRHIGDYYLRLYLIASNEFLNNAKLKLIRDNSFEKIPDQVIESLTDSSSDETVSSLDYHITKRIEYFHLVLQLCDKKPGRALAVITMISEKEYHNK